MPASIADDLLASPGAAALTAAGWRVMYAATHSAGVADLAAERRWSSGKLTARVRLVVHCDSSDRLRFPAIYGGGADALPFYSLAEDEPRQRRALTLLAGPELVEQLQAKAYPRDVALIRRAHIDPLPARARAAAISAAAIDDAFLAVEAIRGDLLAHDLDIARDDLELDRDAAAQTMFEAAHLAHPLHHFLEGDARRVLERPAGADGHHRLGVLDVRPARRAPFDQVDGQVDVHRSLDRRADDLALAHRVVPVAERQQRARHVHAEVNRVAGAHLGAIHVAAEEIRNDRGAHLLSRRDAETAKERRERD